MLVENSVYKNSYTGNGTTTEFPISFPFLEASHVVVYRKSGEFSEELVPANQYTISGAGQENGGTLTFYSPLPAGEVITIRRDVPFTQLMDYTELDNFPAASHENALAKLTMICQQLKEATDRCLIVPSTLDTTPEEVLNNLLVVAEEATKYVKLAEEIYNNFVKDVDTVIQQVEDAGEAQVQRINDVINKEWVYQGLACVMRVWNVEANVPVGASITLPDGMTYLPGYNHFWLSYGGMVISPTCYIEDGELGVPSNSFTTKIPFKKGQELMAWAIPLGRFYEMDLSNQLAEAKESINQLSNALNTLADAVVYAKPIEE